MKNSELWAQYKEYTQDLTANCRKLAFASAAICWFFKSPEVVFPSAILKALGFTVGFFIADILQYLSASVLLRLWTRSKEKRMWAEKKTIEGEYQKPWWLDYPAFFFWCMKILFLLLAYVMIGVQILTGKT